MICIEIENLISLSDLADTVAGSVAGAVAGSVAGLVTNSVTSSVANSVARQWKRTREHDHLGRDFQPEKFAV